MRPLLALLLVGGVTACSGAAGQEVVAGPTADCGEVETVAVQGGSHLLGEQEPPVPYNSTPPTSGWHSSGGFQIGVRGPDEPMDEPDQVSVLESGGVVATHRGLSGADRQELEARAGTEALAGRVAVTPYDALEEGQVVFTSWGVLQRCGALDLAALDAFAATYADEAPDVPGEH